MSLVDIIQAVWQPGEESFMDLLRDPNHWGFELFLMLLFDVLIGALAWPAIKRHIHADLDNAGEVTEGWMRVEINDLRHRLALLEGDPNAILEEVRAGRKSVNWARAKLGYELILKDPPPVVKDY